VRWALPLLDVGVALSTGGPLLALLGGEIGAKLLAALGAALLATGVLLLAHGLHLCPLGQVHLPLGSRTAALDVFLRAAYLWLLVAAALVLWQAIAGIGGAAPGYFALNGARHALTLGFITMMIFGMAARLLSGVSGRPWYQPRLLWLIFATLNASALLRTALQPTLGYSSAGPLLGLAAGLGLVSFWLFAIGALQTLARRTKRVPAGRDV
jgi:hypothetical protein